MTDCTLVQAHTFGKVLRGRAFDGLSVEEVLMPPSLRVGSHAHEGAQIYFLLEGTYVEACRTGRHTLRAGQTWFRPAGEAHENAVIGDDPALTLIVTVERCRYDRLEHLSIGPAQLQSLLIDEVRAELVRELRRADASAVTALEAWALLLLTRTERLLATGSTVAPQWLPDAVHFIETSWQQPISLAAVATHVGVHPATLAAAFRRFHSTSVGSYLRRCRLGHAREALLQTNEPIKSIAVDAGFYDQAHFGRCFKAQYGVTPASARLRRAV
ncbi:MAG TPA: AraC family transcriptional regulator [Thermoanaerobaculia bacterium]